MQMQSYEHAVTGHWTGGPDEAGLRRWVEQLRRQWRAPGATLGLVFMTPEYFEAAAQVLEVLQVHGRIPLLAGCSSHALIVGGNEVETNAGLVLGLYHLPGARLTGVRFSQAEVEESNGPAYWQHATGVPADQSNGWLVFADPFNMDGESWLQQWNEAYPAVPTLGGLAGGNFEAQRTQVYLNREVFEDGAVAVSFGGAVELEGVISQGCTPIGEPWTITRTDGNVIQQIGNQPAYQVLADTFNELPAEQQQRARGNLFVGLVINEYQEEFHRGDFLIRNLLGGDPQSGVLAVGALPRPGQSLQFQTRDAAAATEDLTELLRRALKRRPKARLYGGCLCSCNGRGTHLFGRANHDAGLTQEILGPFGLTGFFCNGEIGPVGNRNFLHGYTASLALFREKPTAAPTP
jgi:small ligand-binding sensory domain FIST